MYNIRHKCEDKKGRIQRSARHKSLCALDVNRLLKKNRTPILKMKVAFALLVLLPLVFSATVDEKRFLESVIGEPNQPPDLYDLAKQLLDIYGPNQTLDQCKSTNCPELLVNTVYGNNALITNSICGPICREVQILGTHYLTTPPFQG